MLGVSPLRLRWIPPEPKRRIACGYVLALLSEPRSSPSFSSRCANRRATSDPKSLPTRMWMALYLVTGMTDAGTSISAGILALPTKMGRIVALVSKALSISMRT